MPSNMRSKLIITMYAITNVTPTLIDNNGIVAVHVRTYNPTIHDWVGAFSPPNQNISSASPILFHNCSYASSYLRSGKAILYFKFTNIRSSVGFYYFTNGIRHPIAMYKSNLEQIVNFRDENQHLHQRVVATGDPNIFSILWSSKNSTSPMVRWGRHADRLDWIVSGRTNKIHKEELCGGVATAQGWREPGLIHIANITGFVTMSLANQDIYYQVGDSADQSFSDIRKFHVPSLGGSQPPHRQTRILMVGDLGVGLPFEFAQVWEEACIPAYHTVRSMQEYGTRGLIADAVVHVGDLAYANGNMVIWEFYMNMISPIAGSVLYLTMVGNHESDWPGASLPFSWNGASGGECSVPALKLFPMPAPATIKKPWWSYDIGLTHIVAISTEHNYSVGSEQYQWLRYDLQTTNRSITPWIVFCSHRPFYVDSDSCCGKFGDTSCRKCALGSDVGDMQQLQKHVEPLLHHYKVNLGVSGHYHDMQRQSAVYQNRVIQKAVKVGINGTSRTFIHYKPNATVWIIAGSGGNQRSFANKMYPWSESYFDNTVGYGIITVKNATTLVWELVNSTDDKVLETVIITQEAYSQEIYSGTRMSASSFRRNDGNVVVHKSYSINSARCMWIGIGVSLIVMIANALYQKHSHKWKRMTLIPVLVLVTITIVVTIDAVLGIQIVEYL